MTADELRHKYIDFFERHGHVAISGRSLIPENDPTVLFTTAGMHPLVPYILGEEHPAGTRLVNCQKCIRTGDIDAVGDRHHLTFFEMLGNWSLGDYFKEEAITLSWRFLTEPQWLGIPAERLLITLFAGDRQVPADSESAGIWRSLGVPDDRIRWLGRADNWWGPAGKTGPCGPDTEIFIDTGGAPDSPADDRYLEVWNDVFMEYNRIADGSYERLERRCVDTGMGLERMIAVLQGCESVYDTDLFAPLIAGLSELTGAHYRHDEETDRSTRIICDHLKAAVFIIGDEQGVSASNIGRGYILRRLLRRAVRHGRKLSMEQAFLHRLTDRVVAIYRHAYPQLGERREQIADEVHAEERRFLQTLRKGEQEFAKLLPTLLDDERRVIPGEVAFRLYDTFGFPLEITIELAAEHGLTVDAQDFERRFHEHRRRSKADDKSTFKGGLADSSVQTTRLHSATHLLQSGPPRCARRSCRPEGEQHYRRTVALRFYPPCPDDRRGALAGGADRQSADRAHPADRMRDDVAKRGPPTRGDCPVWRQVSRDGQGLPHRRLFDGGVRRTACRQQRRIGAFPDREGAIIVAGGAAHQGHIGVPIR